jgi:L-2,4-diaminobutyrate decarboxylase
VERAVTIMGIPAENVIKIPTDDAFRIRTDLLESAYRAATDDGKIVFCVVGCACTTAVGAYDDCVAIASFARKHKLWFHVDGAHGGAAVFSDQYRHLLAGAEQSDSLVLDFHKMMLVPALSTAVVFHPRNRAANAFAPKAAYLWQNQQEKEWYNSAKHTLECTKPITILHTYAIMRFYGDEIYRQHIDTLYDLGRAFARMITESENMELAVEPSGNIVCFRCLSGTQDDDELNQKIYDALLRKGVFYIVSTTIRGKFYLRVSLMNPLTDLQTLKDLLEEIAKTADLILAR